MDHTEAPWKLGGKAFAVLVLSVWSTAVPAQLVSPTTQPLPTAASSVPAPAGQAAAVRASSAGVLPVTLADTGTLGAAGDAREASQLLGNVPSLLAAEVLHAVAIGWDDQAVSEASLANLGVMVAGLGISADFVMASATAAAGSARGTALVENLSIGGVPIEVSAAPNQVVEVTGGRVVINEQNVSAGGIAVNALHIMMDGVADVVVGSATAALR